MKSLLIKIMVLMALFPLIAYNSNAQSNPSCVTGIEFYDSNFKEIGSGGGQIELMAYYNYESSPSLPPNFGLQFYTITASVSYSLSAPAASVPCSMSGDKIYVTIPKNPTIKTQSIQLNINLVSRSGSNCSDFYRTLFFTQHPAVTPANQLVAEELLTNKTSITNNPITNSITQVFFRSQENYIVSTTPFVAMESINRFSAFGSIISMVYYDGLGRPMQEVSVYGSNDGKDLVRPIVYDTYGREEKTYLPYQRGQIPGQYTPNVAAISAQEAFHNSLHGSTDGAYAFAQKLFEASPLNRVLKESAPGRDWNLTNGRPNSMAYSTNVAGEVALWSVTSLTNVLSKSATYANALLYVNEITDADGHKVREYKDMQGNVIEKRQVSPTGQSLVTSYVYDDYNRLRVVVPPKAQALAVNSADFNKLVYRYNYDNMGRMTEKKLPDSDAVYMVYDNRDRLVMTQDGELRPVNKWRVTYYDNMNRPVVEGIITTALAHGVLQTYCSAASVNQTRTNGAYNLLTINSNIPALSATTVLSYTYYDNYSGNALAYTAGHFKAPVPAVLAAPKGQTAWANVKVLDGNEHTAAAKWVAAATHYDNKYRPAQVRKHLYDGAANGTLSISTNFAFDGNPENVREIQAFNAVSTTVDMSYTYDHVRRPVETRMNNVLISTNTYDALGRARIKTLGNAEAVNYAYNIRDWITEIKSPKFETQLFYNTSPAAASVKPLFNGNIAAATWRHSGGAQQNYLYAYDGFSRLTQGIHSGNKYEKDIDYDANGNITNLARDNGNSTVLYTDTEFRAGMNGISAYNNLVASSTVAVARVPKSADCPTTSTHYIKITNTGAASPGLGGFYWATPSSVNRSMTVRITAKIPAGYSIQYNSGSIGIGSKYSWAGSQAGTGSWKTYSISIKCGATGTFGATNYFFISGGAYGTLAKPVEWYVGSATVVDNINESNYEYTYDGNRLTSLKKNGASYNYAYDKNGNTISDGLRGISLSYNVLNLPRSATKGADRIEYIYSAGGEKLAKKRNNQFIQFYCGSMVYTGAKVLEYVMHPEGLALKNGAAYDYQYNLADHLGNVRTVLTDKSIVVQANDYYPFGLTHSTVANLNKNKYLYNGKELQTDVLSGTAFEQLDYGARFYDPTIARWHVIDPLAEKSRRWSPYTYCYNNPMNAIDPDGQFAWFLPAIKVVGGAIIGAGTDLVAQVGVNMSNGDGFFESFGNVDWTSVGSSGLVGAALAPGAGTAVRLTAGIGIVADAAVDVSTNSGVGLVGVNKTVGEAAIDFAASVAGAGISKVITGTMAKEAAKDLIPKVYAPLTKAGKESVRTINRVANSEGTKAGVDAISQFSTKGSAGHLKGHIRADGVANPIRNENQPLVKVDLQRDKTTVVTPIKRF